MSISMTDLLQKVEDTPSVTVNIPGQPNIAMRLICNTSIPIDWDKRSLEKEFDMSIPEDLEELWTQTNSLTLFEDEVFGQWGLYIFGPNEIKGHHMDVIAEQDEYILGDLIVGRFIGDSDLLVLRCDPKAKDFGNVVIAGPIDSRSEWPIVSTNLKSFIHSFLDEEGDKFWERYQ